MSISQVNQPKIWPSSTEEAEVVSSGQSIRSRSIRVAGPQNSGMWKNGVTLGRTNLKYARHSTDIAPHCGVVSFDDAVIVTIKADTHSTTTINEKSVVPTRRSARMPRADHVTHYRSTGSREYIVTCAAQDIARYVEIVLDRPLVNPVLFEPSFVSDQGVGAQLRATVLFVVDSIDRNQAIMDSRLNRANLDEMLLNAISSLPSNYSEELHCGRPQSDASQLVRQAEEFIAARASEPLFVADILRHTNCRKKVLFSNFKKYRGYTPTQFVTATRLRMAHQGLQNPSPGDSVTSIALNCGFPHLGRFSSNYRKHYGTNPSDTLRSALL